jgi:tetratricopeptide (TPR) repeat protein
MVALSSEQGFSYFLAWGTLQRGAALIAQEQWKEGVAQIQQGLEAYEGETPRTMYLAWLAEGYRGAGQVDDGLAAITEALRLVDKNDERLYEAELYRIKGELTLAQSSVQRLASGVRKNQKSKSKSQKSKIPNTQHLTPSTQAEAEACFLKAIEIAQKQQAKSLELRATMSLARLWQQQGKKKQAHDMLAEVYHWFTEGFDTKDLQEAKALLEGVSRTLD